MPGPSLGNHLKTVAQPLNPGLKTLQSNVSFKRNYCFDTSILRNKMDVFKKYKDQNDRNANIYRFKTSPDIFH